MNEFDAHSLSNKNKALSGAQMSKEIEKKLDELKDGGVIIGYSVNEKFRHKGFGYNEQFLANYIIETVDHKRIVVRSSSSFRNDRAKIGFYDLDGILRLSNLTDNIIATIYLVSDSELNNKTFIELREKFKRREYYCPATHLFVLSEFIKFLENYYLEKATLLSGIQKELYFKDLKEAGSYFGREGNRLERELVERINEPLILKKIKKDALEPKIEKIIKTILSKHGIDREDLVKIKASNSIPLLRNGGNPKTDILITLITINDETILETISVKKTQKNKVSCHDYKADDFIRVLSCEGTKLEKYFKLFEKYPTYTEFEENLPDEFSTEDFSNLMETNAKVFSEWVLRGKHDELNLVDPDKQVSNFILISKDGKLMLKSYDKYIETLFGSSKKKFGVPFTWTYPSKQRGKRIQLKMPVIID